MKNIEYNNVIVPKPWGKEYLAYQNDDVALWCLHINKGESTSMHCHPKKTTGLVVISGEIELSFLADKRIMKPLDKAMIRRGLFHKSTALTDSILLEIETPNDKEDLVRLEDSYGRANKSYETELLPKTGGEFNFNEPKQYFTNNGFFIDVFKINDLSYIKNSKDRDVIIFLKGGMIRNINNIPQLVTVPGDVGHGLIVKQVANNLDGVMADTVIMKISEKYHVNDQNPG